MSATASKMDRRGETVVEPTDKGVEFRDSILLNAGHNLRRGSHETGHLEGGNVNVGNNDFKSNPIYTRGSANNPTESALSNMFGVGYCNSGAAFIDNGLDGGGAGFGLYVAASGNATIFLNGTTGVINANGAINGNVTSDENLKTNRTPITSALDSVKLLRTDSYTKKVRGEKARVEKGKKGKEVQIPAAPDTSVDEVGIYAQDIQQVFPHMVGTNKDGDLTVKQGGNELISLAFACIKELITKVEELEARFP